MSQTKAQLISDLVQALAFTATASAPTNGMFLSDTNELAISTNSNTRLTVDSDGRLLVGLTSDLSGDTSSTAIQIATAGGGFLGLARNDSSVSAGNSLGGLRIYSNAPSGYDKVADIRCEADGTFDTDDYPLRS